MKILIYNGPGVSAQSLKQLLTSFERIFKATYDVATVTAEKLRTDPWEEHTAVLAFPGGRDIPYVESVDAATIARIQRWVAGGGRYIGFCAGAYFASSSIEFEKGRMDMEVIGTRPLSLFSGIAKGSVSPNFTYNSEIGALAMDIRRCDDGHVLSAYVNGGCYFELPHPQTDPAVKTLASFVKPDKPAVILVNYGSGKALLSGAHIEYTHGQLMCQLGAELLPRFEPLRGDSALKFLCDIITEHLGLKTVPLEQYEASRVWMTIGDFLNVKAPAKLDTIANCQASYNFIDLERLRQCSSPSHCIGSSIIYAEVVTSTQAILLENAAFCSSLPNGTIFLAGHQLNGRGRGNNKWISSNGCLQFSLVLDQDFKHVPIQMVQYITAIAVVLAARIPNQDQLNVSIKWPNDIYSKGQKIGGLLVNAQTTNDKARLIIGIGINIGEMPNARCLNDEYRDQHIEPTSKEAFLGEFCKVFGSLYESWQQSRQFPFDLYYALWLHRNARVFVESENAEFVINGLDGDGYLEVSSLGPEKRTLHLQPDGNSFDLMRNLIQVKR